MAKRTPNYAIEMDQNSEVEVASYDEEFEKRIKITGRRGAFRFECWVFS